MGSQVITRIHTIITHWAFHVEELLAILMLKAFGEHLFPGISQAKIEFWRTLRSPERRIAEEYEREGTLLVGVGGGRFDEHGDERSPRKEEECSATLVAKALNLLNHPALRQLLMYVCNADLKTGVGALELPSLIKTMHRANPDHPEIVFEWGTRILSAQVMDQERYWQAVEVMKSLSRLSVKYRHPHFDLHFAVVESDNWCMLRAALAAKDIALLVQRNSRGQVQIFTNQHYNLNFDLVIAHIRLLEQKKAGNVVTTELDDLLCEGTVPGDDHWHYFPTGGMLLNGSNTRPDVLPTRLTLEEIAKIIHDHLRIWPPPTNHR